MDRCHLLLKVSIINIRQQTKTMPGEHSHPLISKSKNFDKTTATAKNLRYINTANTNDERTVTAVTARKIPCPGSPALVKLLTPIVSHL